MDADLRNAARDGDLEQVQSLLKNGASVHGKSRFGDTALHYAANHGHAEIAQLLMHHLAEVNCENKHGCTPLHYASQNGHAAVVTAIILHGGDITVTNKRLETPLQVAKNEKVKALLTAPNLSSLLEERANHSTLVDPEPVVTLLDRVASKRKTKNKTHQIMGLLEVLKIEKDSTQKFRETVFSIWGGENEKELIGGKVRLDRLLKRINDRKIELDEYQEKIRQYSSEGNENEVRELVIDRDAKREDYKKDLQEFVDLIERVYYSQYKRQAHLDSELPYYEYVMGALDEVKSLDDDLESEDDFDTHSSKTTPCTSPEPGDDDVSASEASVVENTDAFFKEVDNYMAWKQGFDERFKSSEKRTNELIMELHAALAAESRDLTKFFNKTKQVVDASHGFLMRLQKERSRREYQHVEELLQYFTAEIVSLQALQGRREEGKAARLNMRHLQQDIADINRDIATAEKQLQLVEGKKEEPQFIAATRRKKLTKAALVVNNQRLVQTFQSLAQHPFGYPEYHIDSIKYAKQFPSLSLDNDDEVIMSAVLQMCSWLTARNIDKDYSGNSTFLVHRPHALLKAERFGKERVLKKFFVGEEASDMRREFAKQVDVIQGLKHRGVMPINEVFFDNENNMAVVDMPFYAEGTLKENQARMKLGLTKPDNEIALDPRHIFCKMFEGLRYLHSLGITHGNLSWNNVMLRDDCDPVLVDYFFDKSQFVYTPQVTHRCVKGCLICKIRVPFQRASISQDHLSAEEIEAGQTRYVIPATDIWHVGVMMFTFYFPECKRGVPNQIPPHSNVALRDLLSRILVPDPSERPSATEALEHPFFTLDDALEERPDAIYLSARKEMQFMRVKCLESKPVLVKASSRSLVTDILDACSGMSDEQRMRPLHFDYRDYDQVNRYGKRVAEPKPERKKTDLDLSLLHQSFQDALFDPDSKHGLFDVGSSKMFFLPSNKCLEEENTRDRLFGIGVYMGRCIWEGIPFVGQFGPSLWKFLYGERPTFHDLEVFDPEQSRYLRYLSATPGVESLRLKFLNGEDVLDENKVDYMTELVQHVLLGSRKEALQLVKDGFFTFRYDNVPALHPLDLRLYMSRTKPITGDAVFELLNFDERVCECVNAPMAPGEECKNPYCCVTRMRTLLDSFHSDDLKRFMCLVSGLTTIPTRGLTNPNPHAFPRNKMVISVPYIPESLIVPGIVPKGQKPETHVALMNLNLPEYETLEELETNIRYMITHIDELAATRDAFFDKANHPN